MASKKQKITKKTILIIANLDTRGGWSFLDKEGRPFYDPETDKAFVDEIKRRLKPEIPVIEVDVHLNTPQFGKKAVELFHRLFTQWCNKK